MRRGDTGRFFPSRYEARRQDRDIAIHQRSFGTAVLWYFFDPGASAFDDIYSEGQDYGGGRRWFGPHTIPVVSANRREGMKVVTDDGLYSLDTIDLRLSYEQARKSGLLPEVSRNHEVHLNDRFIYDDRVWGIRDISTTGQFDPSGHDVMVRVQGVQLHADELVNDLDFQRWSLNSEDITAQIIITPGQQFDDFSIRWEDSRGVGVPLGEWDAFLSVYADTYSPNPLLAIDSLTPGVGITLAQEGGISVVLTAAQTQTLAPYAGRTIAFTLLMISNVQDDYSVELIHRAALVVRTP